jgi:ligand-binding SRPBCC domain-containing protein
MAAHSLKMVQKIPAPVGDVWKLFSQSANLVQLTPAGMDIRIVSAIDDRPIYPGQIIEYKLKPLWGMTIRWITEIGVVEQERFFMDIQRKGPYRLWEHKHYFQPIQGGVEMTDIVNYQIPMGILGRMANSVLVKQKLRQVFEHRFRQVEKLLGKWDGQQASIHLS